MDVIKVKNLSKSFGSKSVHKDINLSVSKGECLGLIGGSGSGKSVLLRSLIGLEKPDKGEILIVNENIVNMNEDSLIDVRIKVAYVFQGGALFDSMTVFENLAYPLREHTAMTEDEIEHKVLTILENFGLAGSEYLFPASLSGGMQKRTGLARSIIMEPEIILYDEPTAGLDPYNTKKIQETALKLKKTGVTSIFVSHDMPTIMEVCDKIAFIQNGYVKELLTVEEAKSKKDSTINKFINGEIV